jgi:hypothetical protein
LPAVLIFMLAVAHGALRRQEQKLPFAERITASELLDAIEVQRALQARGIDIEAAVASADTAAPSKAAEVAEETEPSNVASFDITGKAPRKGPQT